MNTFIIMSSRLKTNKGRSSVKTPTSKKSISLKHFFNKENVAPTRTKQTSTTPQYMSGDDLFSLDSVILNRLLMILEVMMVKVVKVCLKMMKYFPYLTPS